MTPSGPSAVADPLVQYGGRTNRPAWTLYPQGGSLRMSLRDAYGSAPAIPVTTTLQWICGDDEIILREPGMYRALQRAGLVREHCTELATAEGAMIVARLTEGCLRGLPAEIRDAAW